jgi:nanoRNase/pAp phosphatase (c-di-AMP/oligoRNAs hydrolase)
VNELFSSFLKKYKDKKLVIATHRSCDADGIASMYALSKVLKNPTIALQDKPSDDTKPLIERLQMAYYQLSDLKKEDYDGLIVVDTNSYHLIKDAKNWKIILLIDHHELESKDISAEFEIINDKAPSNVEIIYDLIEKMDETTAFALGVGIISDTARFKNSDPETFEKISKLIKLSNSTYEELFKYAYPREPIDRRQAILIAMQRIEFIEYKGYLIATSHIGINESQTSTILSDVCDFVFISSEKHHETRTSARASQHMIIPMNQVMLEVGKRLNGVGGGHEKAAGCTVKIDYKTVLRECISVLKEFIDKE